MAGPLSVDEILAKQKAEREASAKPKFISKAERAKLALEKREAEVRAQKKREEEEKKERESFERRAEDERRSAHDRRYGGGDRQSERDKYYDRGDRDGVRYGRDGYGGGGYNRDGRDGRNGRNGYDSRDGRDGRDGRDYRDGRNDRDEGRFSEGRYGSPSGSNGSSSRAPPPGPRGNGHAPYQPSPLAGGSPSSTVPGDLQLPTDTELNSIRARYLGQKVDNRKPRLRKQADKRVIFDWREEDDTSADLRLAVDPSTVYRPRPITDPGDARSGTGTPNTYTDPLEKRRSKRGVDERHWSDKPLEEMKDRDWRIFREDFNISARGGSIPFPLRSWQESKIPPKIIEVIEEVGYKEPSPIQRQAIPIGMQNRDLIGLAKTGSGKTAAFVIPMLDYIGHLPPLDDENRHQGPYALIMAPTRELAQQIESETLKFSTRLGYTCVSIVGGRSVEEQQFALRNGAEIIIATPGRLKDMVDQSKIVLSQCRYIVMDEADRMIDLNYEEQLNFILDSMPSSFSKPDDEAALEGSSEWKGWRVTTLFSATMPTAVQRLAMKYLRKPATVVIGNAGEAVDTVEQRVEFVKGEEKRKNRLIEILRTCGLPPPMIVFVNQKKTADMVVKFVHQAGYSATTLHSDKTQAQREASLKSLRDGETAVLVATDIAGRGIDVPDVSLVINWQMSDTIEKYVHRIGRTGRAGKTGLAITFLNNDDEEVMFELKQEISKSPVSTMNPELARHEAARQKVTREMKRKRDEDD